MAGSVRLHSCEYLCLVLPGTKSPGQELSPSGDPGGTGACRRVTAGTAFQAGSAVGRAGPAPCGRAPARLLHLPLRSGRPARPPSAASAALSGRPATHATVPGLEAGRLRLISVSGGAAAPPRAARRAYCAGQPPGFRPPGPGAARGNQRAAGPRRRRCRRAPDRAGREARTHPPSPEPLRRHAPPAAVTHFPLQSET